MASHIVVATFDNRNQAYDTAYDIDRLDDSLVDFKPRGHRREGPTRQYHDA